MSGTCHEEDPLAKQYDRKLLWRLLTYLKPYKLAVAASFLLIVAMAGLDLVGPWLTKEAIDRHIAHGDSVGLRRLALFYLAALVAQGGFYADLHRRQLLEEEMEKTA